MKKRVVIWCCSTADIEEGFCRASAQEQERDHYHQLDMEIERELGPWPSMDGWTEEADVECVPIDYTQQGR